MAKPVKIWRRPKLVNIYLMWVGNSSIYKIGYTSNHPNERIRVIRFHVLEIKLIDYVLTEYEYEKKLHIKFADQQVKNKEGYREYFILSKYDIEFIINLFNTLKNGPTEEKRS
jgi:hypothetical protein